MILAIKLSTAFEQKIKNKIKKLSVYHIELYTNQSFPGLHYEVQWISK